MFKVGDRVESIVTGRTGIIGAIDHALHSFTFRNSIILRKLASYKLAPSESDALADAVSTVYRPLDFDPEPTIEQLVQGNAELGETIKALESELRGYRMECGDVSGLIQRMVRPGLAPW